LERRVAARDAELTELRPLSRRELLVICHSRGGTPGEDAKLREADMISDMETGQITGTMDKDYNIIWFTEVCLSNALRLETYIKDAERQGDGELADFFRRAQAESRKGAEQGKQLLRARL
jgi:hypothetical protein